jgi:DNA-binding CsgD family transcriptional regulator
MQPRDRLTAKEVQVATLVWQGLTNKDVALVLKTSEQVVKNYLRTTFDKLGVWTRLELALYVAGHGGANWHLQLGMGCCRPRRQDGAWASATKAKPTQMERQKCRQWRRAESASQKPPPAAGAELFALDALESETDFTLVAAPGSSRKPLVMRDCLH